MIPPRQYYLTSTAPETVPDGFCSRTVDSWYLVFDDSFDSIPVVAGDDAIGYVIGTVLDVEDRCEDGEIRLPDGDGASLVEAFEDAISELAGHFLGVVVAGRPYVYTDPIGGCPAVYDPNAGVVAATPALLPGVDHRERFRREFYDGLNRNDNYVFLPGKITYYSGVERLLPNHRLDLQSWEQTRYWPQDPEEVSTYEETTAVAEFIGTELQKIFEEIAATYEKPVNPLTAGQDSRSLLACARPWVEDGTIGTVTWDTGEWIDIDMDVARRLSARHGFEWTPIPVVTATEDEKRQWLEDTGHAVGGTIMNIHPTLEMFDADLHVNGFGGAIARGKYWAESDDASTSLGASELLSRLHRPEHPALVDAVEDWYESVSEFDAYTQLDLLTQELRYGCWAGPHFPGLSRRRDVVSPLAYFPIVRAMFRLQPPVRRAGNVQHVIVDRFWSELNELPYNAYPDLREVLRKAKILKFKAGFALTHPRLTYSYLSHELASK